MKDGENTQTATGQVSMESRSLFSSSFHNESRSTCGRLVPKRPCATPMTKVISRNESYDFVKTSRRAARDMFDEELSPSAHLSPTLLLELCERKPPTSESSGLEMLSKACLKFRRPRCHACLQNSGFALLASHKHIAYRDYYRMGRNSKRLKFNFWSLWKCSPFLFHICIALNISLPHTRRQTKSFSIH